MQTAIEQAAAEKPMALCELFFSKKHRNLSIVIRDLRASVHLQRS